MKWEGIVKDLHQSCEDRDQGATRALLENEKETILTKARKEHYEREEARMKTELESKKEEVADLKKSLEKEMDNFPRGYVNLFLCHMTCANMYSQYGAGKDGHLQKSR